jgi:hypothetical protein
MLNKRNLVLLAVLASLFLTTAAFADATIHTLKWKHFDGTNPADTEFKFDKIKLGKGQPAIDALYKQIATLPAGDQINIRQGVEKAQGQRQFPFNLMQLIKYAQRYGVIVNVPKVDAPK